MDVISYNTIDKAGLAPCNEEEADTRIFILVKHASVSGMTKILIGTVEPDVILAIEFEHKLEVEELWVAFGVGKNLRYSTIHKIASSLTTLQYEELPFFHALTGCDTVSFLSGRGKKSAFQAWKCYSEATEGFSFLSSPQAMMFDEQFKVMERFIAIMYNRTTPHQDVNKAPQSMFSQGTRTQYREYPANPISAETTCKEGCISSRLCLGTHVRPPRRLGVAPYFRWVETDLDYLPEASKACNELIRCGCKSACRGLCKCTKANLPCTALCACNGNC